MKGDTIRGGLGRVPINGALGSRRLGWRRQSGGPFSPPATRLAQHNARGDVRPGPGPHQWRATGSRAPEHWLARQARRSPFWHHPRAPPGEENEKKTFKPFRVSEGKEGGGRAERTGTSARGPCKQRRKLPDPILLKSRRSRGFPVRPGRVGWGECTPPAARPARGAPGARAPSRPARARRARGRAPASGPGPRRRLPG